MDDDRPIDLKAFRQDKQLREGAEARHEMHQELTDFVHRHADRHHDPWVALLSYCQRIATPRGANSLCEDPELAAYLEGAAVRYLKRRCERTGEDISMLVAEDSE